MGYIFCWVWLVFWPGGKPPAGILPVLFFMMGFTIAGMIPVWACAKEVNPAAVSGSAMDLANMGGFLGAAVMQPLFGWALDQKWQGVVQDGMRLYPLEAFRFVMTIILVMLIGTWLSIFFLKESYGGLKE